ncbi:unnamed protein product [Moneuplotes crassus]|uniref:C2 domain-containing protein n=1 Tax=Euplotes crassus TaxID=5936 RepID=A0AAD1Y5X8_EUPCR|nr:unnamed protein product [Moneuplotes crassus]
MLGLDQQRREDFTTGGNKTLNFRIESCEFLSAAKYYITCQLDEYNEKKRTELSDELTNPLFISNNFTFPLPTGKIEMWQRCVFGLYMIIKNKYNYKNEAKCVGETVLDLGQLATLINSPDNLGVKQSLSFTKHHQGEELQVGRFNITISIENDYSKARGQEGSYFNGAIDEPIEATSMVHHMPPEKEDYVWRLRIDLRCCIDAPMNIANATKLPSCYAEFGWSKDAHTNPSAEDRMLSLLIPQERHPHWNQQLLYHNPAQSTERDGFFWITLYDRDNNKIHSNIFTSQCNSSSNSSQHTCRSNESQMILLPNLLCSSLTLEEEIESFVDTPCTVALRWIDFDPLPLKTRNFCVIMTTDDKAPENDPFIKVDLREEQAIARAFKFTNDFSNEMFISPWYRMPPDPIKNKFSSLCYFLVPKSYLDKNVRFFVVVKDDNKVSTHGMPNLVVGTTDIADQELRRSLYSTDHDYYTFPVNYFPDLTIVKHLVMSKCKIDVSCHPIEVVDKLILDTRGQSRVRSRKVRRPDHLDIYDEKDRWQLLSKDVAQKQELIHRIMKDNNERSLKLRETGKEVLDLRKQLKLLKVENFNIAKKVETLKEIDSKSMITADIKDMHYADVKNKLLKLAQAYNTEKMRNNDYETKLRKAHKMEEKLLLYEKDHSDKAERLLQQQSELKKASVYNDTIKKQEVIISKLQKIYEKIIIDNKRAEDGASELEYLKDDIKRLQVKVKELSFGEMHENSELERLRKEVYQLEHLLIELNGERMTQNAQKSKIDDYEEDKIEHEVHLQKARARCEAVETELKHESTRFAQEIAQLETILAEKNATLENMTFPNRDVNRYSPGKKPY